MAIYEFLDKEGLPKFKDVIMDEVDLKLSNYTPGSINLGIQFDSIGFGTSYSELIDRDTNKYQIYVPIQLKSNGVTIKTYNMPTVQILKSGSVYFPVNPST